MTKTDQDATIWAGDYKTLEITVKDSDGDIKDISGVTNPDGGIEWILQRNPDSQSADLSKSLSDGGINLKTDGTDGIFQVTLTEDDTKDLSSNYYHEAEVTLSGQPATVTEGTIEINKTGT